MAILTGVRYLKVVMNCISLMSGDIDIDSFVCVDGFMAEESGQLRHLPQAFSASLFETGYSHWPELIKSQGSAYLSISSVWITSRPPHLAFFYMGNEVELRSSGLATTLLSCLPNPTVPQILLCKIQIKTLWMTVPPWSLALNIRPAFSLLYWLKSSKDTNQARKHLSVVDPPLSPILRRLMQGHYHKFEAGLGI